MDNFLCTTKLPVCNVACDENHVNDLQTLRVDPRDADSIKSLIEASRATGQPIIIDTSHISVAGAIYMAGAAIKQLPLAVCAPLPQPKLFTDDQLKHNIEFPIKPLNIDNLIPPNMELQREKAKASDLQLKELNAADISAETKKLIAGEYVRLRRLHPKWRVSKAMRKAGEKYSIKFVFHE